MANTFGIETASNSRRSSKVDIMPTQCERPSSTQSEPFIRSINQIAKQLKSNCDKILDRSVPFVIDSSLLWTICDTVHQVTTNRIQDSDDIFNHHLLFLADFFEQTPSLVIAQSDVCASLLLPGSLDLTLFRGLEFLELRKVAPQFLYGLNTRRCKLRRIKSSRNVESIDELFQVVAADHTSLPVNSTINSLSPTLTSVWPELREIDCSFNRITQLDTASLECTPALELLNLSRNRITTINSSLSRILQTLTVLNLNFNQLTCIPPTPSNLKVLLLSNNYIPTLLSRHTLPESLEMLDLSQNVFSDDREIESVRRLTALRSLAFIGNPITYSSNYRKLVTKHLSRAVLKNKSFVLDQKKLSASEVRCGLESVVRPPPIVNPVPFFARSMSSSVSTAQSDRLADLRSLTQSIDSSSSSLRSACRKKAKIRELVILDTDDSLSPSPNNEFEDTVKISPKSHHSSDSSSSSIEEVVATSDEAIKATRDALQSIRKKYGDEFWLYRQGGEDVKNLLNIESHQDTSVVKKSPTSFATSEALTRDASFYSALSEWELSSTTTTVKPENGIPAMNRTPSDESIKPIEDDFTNSSSDGTVFYPCHSESLPDSPDSSISESLNQLEMFRDPGGHAEHFRCFESGTIYQMTVLDHFLYQMDSNNEKGILTKWDLKSLQSLREEKRFEETESVHFELKFDTRRKHLQQKFCVMSIPDFRRFHNRANTFLQARTIKEYGEGFQCAKCDWEFSRAMANTTVVCNDGRVPHEVPICPNPLCQSDLLIPLDVEREAIQSPPINVPSIINWGEARTTSSPIVGGLEPYYGGRSLPIDPKSPVDFLPPHSLPFHQSTPKTHHVPNTTNPSNNKEPKSESDIETLSCDDSSSIEILPTKTTSSSGSDVAVVEEALELDTPELVFNAAKSLGLPMTDSTSSTGSCTGSICTQYEKTITATSNLSQAVATSLASVAFSPASQPIKYDYEKFTEVDHRLKLHCDLTLFKHQEERLLALTKVAVMTTTGNCSALVIFSNKKTYFCKIIGPECDKIDSWLQFWKCFQLTKLSKLEVLIGRHGLGLDFSGSYFGLLFRDSTRTSNFIEFFLSEICGEFEIPPLVQDFSQTQKALMSPTNPIAYFGILRKASCRNAQGNDKLYSLCAVVVTTEELILVADLSCLVNRASESVSVKHVRELVKLRQVECLEAQATFVRLVFQVEDVMLKWELSFETEAEKKVFLDSLQNNVKEVPFISLSEPRLP